MLECPLAVPPKDLSFSPEIRDVFTKDHFGNEYKILTIGKRSYIAEAQIESTGIDAHILIGNYCSIGHDVHFHINTQHDYQMVSTFPWNNPYNKVFDYQGKNKTKNQILIGHDVWIGRGAVLQGGIKIGNGAVIASNAVVTKDVEPYAIVGGNPARLIKYRFSSTIIERLNQIKWWYWQDEKILKEKDKITGDIDAFVRAFYPENTVAFQQVEVEELATFHKAGNRNYFFLLDADEKKLFGWTVMLYFCLL